MPGVVFELDLLVDVVGFGEADHELAGVDVGDARSEEIKINKRVKKY
jgi:hypothetical protein